ncbi:metalloregulator ArsR/SmtB family transcription factor [Streptosporangium sp. NBC_01755]|uniref:ArsR/SmtB family transcription factor n=1 Tax=unclassified Streptosporangium TaxID=2632669 RepID=UPI002DDB81DB|nr:MULTISPECIES: metalloregulator ArsR/SmtB family transcription factor [unclassified Streptosporangium]WSA28420.1 metalloregulator ArsR/SmtB family transcription factor [Streptosporangium sp. NBC_01810]WSD00090.1 metalloregulator ArsR/SmtB family transcription factor [Streptosporangium sp. NBC_01755]
METGNTDIELTDAARGFLKAMASDTRQQILMLFAGGIELTVGEVAERMALAQSATSTHLATLRDGGVLSARREWKTVYYRADPGRIGQALADLQLSLQACCPPNACTSDAACG